jgi:hypothetical protein
VDDAERLVLHFDLRKSPLAPGGRRVYDDEMTYIGRIQNGVVVLPPEAKLPEGTQVTVELIEAGAEPRTLTQESDPFLAAIQKIAKPRPHWPEDYVLNHGHYVSGEPKKS